MAVLVTTWLTRLAWLLVAVLGGQAVGAAIVDHPHDDAVVMTVAAWAGWAAGALALAVPGVTTLTVARVVVPGSLAVALVAIVGGAPATDAVALGGPALVATVFVLSGDVGRAWVQASAYGDEQRFPLRPPAGYLIAAVVSWLVAVGAAVALVVAVASSRWVAAGFALLGVGLAAWWLPRRWHQLSRRWLVTVPAGLVVHDPVVLADTLMIPRRSLTGLTLTRVGRGRPLTAADLTGPASGPAVEITVAEPATVVYAPTRQDQKGRAIHARALVVSPSRPGAVLDECRRRRLPVQ